MARRNRHGTQRRSAARASRRRTLAVRVAELLHRTYGSPDHNNKEDPLDEVVFIVLSQMTTHWSFNRVYSRLKRRFPEWERVLDVSEASLRRTIRGAGLSRMKAARLRAIVARVVADYGVADLSALGDVTDSEALEYLCSLPGIGEKTARCVLLYSFDRAVLPVDTHVWRICRRLGLVDYAVSYIDVHRALESVVPPRARYSLHVNGMMLGREACTARRPRCSECPLVQLCPRRLSA